MRPSKGTISAQVWELAEALTANGAPPPRGSVIAAAIAKGIHAKTASTQFGAWKRAHFPGIDRKSTPPRNLPLRPPGPPTLSPQSPRSPRPPPTATGQAYSKTVSPMARTGPLPGPAISPWTGRPPQPPASISSCATIRWFISAPPGAGLPIGWPITAGATRAKKPAPASGH